MTPELLTHLYQDFAEQVAAYRALRLEEMDVRGRVHALKMTTTALRCELIRRGVREDELAALCDAAEQPERP